jgi:hypothetical protein
MPQCRMSTVLTLLYPTIWLLVCTLRMLKTNLIVILDFGNKGSFLLRKPVTKELKTSPSHAQTPSKCVLTTTQPGITLKLMISASESKN